jgi:hypothetical protein
VTLIVLITDVLRRAHGSITTLSWRYRLSSMRAPLAACLATIAALVAPATAAARPAAADRLWATVNVCDTAKHPNEVGIRASMPGTPRGTSRLMRFRVQWRDGDRWRYVTGADSDWRKLTRARGRAIESGWGFEFEPPAKAITFRGVVRFRWLRDGRVVGRALEITESGHRSTAGADPADYSAATCSMA